MKNKWIHNPWTISIGTALLSICLTAIYDLIKDKPFLSTLLHVVTWIFELIVSVLTFKLSLWIVILLMVGLWLFIRVRNLSKKVIDPDFWNYKRDVFNKWIWKWDYEFLGSSWDIINLRPHCPNCETMLINKGSMYHGDVRCPRCNYRATDKEIESTNDTKVLIIDNIQKGAYN